MLLECLLWCPPQVVVVEVDKVFSVLMVRHSKNNSRALEVSQRLRDNRDLQHFLQNTQDVSSLPPCVE